MPSATHPTHKPTGKAGITKSGVRARYVQPPSSPKPHRASPSSKFSTHMHAFTRGGDYSGWAQDRRGEKVEDEHIRIPMPHQRTL